MRTEQKLKKSKNLGNIVNNKSGKNHLLNAYNKVYPQINVSGKILKKVFRQVLDF